MSIELGVCENGIFKLLRSQNRDPAQIEQAIPVGVVVRQTRDLQTQHNAHMSECHFSCHTDESRALHRYGARQAEVFIDHGHLLSGPSEAQCSPFQLTS